VSATSTPYGKVLVVGSGAYAFYYGDAYIGNLPGDPYGTARIDGDGMSIPWGTFNAISLP
jgi:hypothetical protein